MTNTTTLDRSWVMHRAWHYMRVWHPKRLNMRALADALRYAWGDMKAKMRGLRLIDEMSGNEMALAALEAKELTTPQDRDKMEALRTAIAHERAEADYQAKRELIQAAPCAVTFTKADGTQRTMQIVPGKLVANGDAVSKAYERATKTRKARHPHLLPVWDAEAGAARSVNLATISRIATPSGVHSYV